MQAITYNEFLPKLLGEDALDAYDGYDVNVDPAIANIFSTAAYRLGHTMLSSTVHRTDEEGSENEFGGLSLQDAFFRPDRLIEEGVLMPCCVALAQAKRNPSIIRSSMMYAISYLVRPDRVVWISHR